jgi:DNA-directed RNA polymerase specialized sigma24 family protein|tara:strand:+ start:1793 stop:2110 length:318 start_codon:yes stop_codon:yes gene_type:complete
VSKNLWYAKLRKLGKEIPSEALEEVSVETESEDKEGLYEQLEVIVQQLGGKCQEILKQFYFMKFNMKTIADKLGYNSVNTAKTQKYKCLERAKKLAAVKLNEYSH